MLTMTNYKRRVAFRYQLPFSSSISIGSSSNFDLNVPWCQEWCVYAPDLLDEFLDTELVADEPLIDVPFKLGFHVGPDRWL